MIDPETPLPMETLSEAKVRSRSRRDFLALGLGTAGLAAAWAWVVTRPERGEIPGPLRSVLNFDGRVSQAVLGTRRLAREFPLSKAVANLRVNGDIGITQDLDLSQWRLQIFGVPGAEKMKQFSADAGAWDYGVEDDDDTSEPDNSPKSTGATKSPKEDADGLSYGSSNGSIPQSGATKAEAKQPGLLLTMADLKLLPRCETVTELKCIEGWSEIAHWGGARMSDLLAMIGGPATKYVGFETPSADFYASQDMATMHHPQTLLAYELNGEALSPLHGAPLRLATPLKYGYKQIKQVSKIFFSDERPRDYWVENGYDWYGGH